jgi:hypothetical protein
LDDNTENRLGSSTNNNTQTNIETCEWEICIGNQTESSFDNDSASPILNNQGTSKGKTSRFAKLKRKKDISRLEDNKFLEQEYELQNWKQETRNTDESSNSEYGFVVQIPSKK